MRVEKKSQDVRVGDFIVGVGRVRSASYDKENEHYTFEIVNQAPVKVYKESNVLIETGL